MDTKFIEITEVHIRPDFAVKEDLYTKPSKKHGESCMLCGVRFGKAGQWSKKNPTNFGFSKKLDLVHQLLRRSIYSLDNLDYACNECAELLLMQEDPFVYFVHDLYKR